MRLVGCFPNHVHIKQIDEEVVGQAVPDTTELIGRPRQAQPDLLSWPSKTSINSEAVYGTKAALFLPEWGRVTRKEGALYLHVFDWPDSGKLTLPALSNKSGKTALLAAPQAELKVDTSGKQWVIELPNAAPSPIASVIKVEVERMPELGSK